MPDPADTPHRRRSIHLPEYDYTIPGAYFVTLCTQDRRPIFGDVMDGCMRLNEAGRMVQAVWEELPARYSCVRTDAFIIMPNHVHGIIVLADGPVVSPGHVGEGLKPSPTQRHGLPEIVRAFKTFSARSVNAIRRSPGRPVWQRGYYERVVRRCEDINRIRAYILDNPRRWELDRDNIRRT